MSRDDDDLPPGSSRILSEDSSASSLGFIEYVEQKKILAEKEQQLSDDNIKLRREIQRQKERIAHFSQPHQRLIEQHENMVIAHQRTVTAFKDEAKRWKEKYFDLMRRSHTRESELEGKIRLLERKITLMERTMQPIIDTPRLGTAARTVPAKLSSLFRERVKATRSSQNSQSDSESPRNI